ncbi:MAG: hypothetical protein DKT66_09200 [Candidatus Melainabacteria bacterium]|nr:MAG: hypothetical protein DKT66_09200 [Candidatus Melainabacteria bacterium]
MWICSCHAVTDGMIKEFAKQHGCAWKKMTQELKVGTQCGTCAKYAKEILEQAAGKPPRKPRKRKTVEDKVSASPAVGISQENAQVSAPVAEGTLTGTRQSDDVRDTEAAKLPESTSSPVYLPCGKCTCTCGK